MLHKLPIIYESKKYHLADSHSFHRDYAGIFNIIAAIKAGACSDFSIKHLCW